MNKFITVFAILYINKLNGFNMLSHSSRNKYLGYLNAINNRIETLELCEENADIIIKEIREELGTIFGYDPKSREVGITGEIEFVELEGPVMSISLKGYIIIIM